jgi:hypothetical protein
MLIFNNKKKILPYVVCVCACRRAINHFRFLLFLRRAAVVHANQTPSKNHRNGEANVPLLQAKADDEAVGEGEHHQQ